MVSTIAQRRKGDRDRQRKWRARQKAQGRTPLTIMISNDIRTILDMLKRESKASYATIVEHAIRAMMSKRQARLPEDTTGTTLKSIAATLIELGQQMQALEKAQASTTKAFQTQAGPSKTETVKKPVRADQLLQQEIERKG